MNITNVHVYDLAESVVASGLPMQAEHSEVVFQRKILDFVEERSKGEEYNNPDFKRACVLARNPAGSGHCNFLSGILVSANVTATNVWWLQMERYHFVQIVSMQSKMHRLRKMIRDQSAVFHSKTDMGSIWELAHMAKDMSDEELAYSCPMGLELTARISTNYLQLKTIYQQRKEHKLQEWRCFCNWIKSLPYSNEFITGEGNESLIN